jgi:ferritin
MNTTVFNAINEQINSEFEASYTYLAMAGFCERQRFSGAAKWLRSQSDEERQHGLKLFDFVLARDGAVDRRRSKSRKLAATGMVSEISSQRAIDLARVTQQINALYELCFKEKAFAEMTELQWFLTEQVEEEKTARDIVAKFKLVGKDPSGLLDMDRELASRAPV